MDRPAPKARIWELDVLRGFCILCVIIVHALFDLVYFLDLPIHFPPLYRFIQDNGGVIFIVLSGICVTLGSKSVQRGLIVFGCGLVITLVTWAMAKLGMAGTDVVVRFGILHLLGVCMLLYPVFKAWPAKWRGALGAALVVLGYVFLQQTVDNRWLYFFGLRYAGFTSGDYFPILPHLGWFLLGSALGAVLYKKKQTRFPKVNAQVLPLRFLSFCGRQSLIIYLIHQPVVYGLIMLVTLL